VTRGAIWLVATIAGFLMLMAIPRVGSGRVKAVLVRAAALDFLGAGAIGAGGWLGRTIETVLTWGTRSINSLGNNMVGTTIVGVLAAVVAVIWVAGMVPEEWFSFQIPDWLSATGLIFPTLAASIPGQFGAHVQAFCSGAGTQVAHLVLSAFQG